MLVTKPWPTGSVIPANTIGIVRDARRIAEHSTEWMIEALCLPKEDGTSVAHLFFEQNRYDKARAICEKCPVRIACVEWAIATHQPDGIWGGLTEKQRKTYRRSKQRRAFRDEQRREGANA